MNNDVRRGGAAQRWGKGEARCRGLLAMGAELATRGLHGKGKSYRSLEHPVPCSNGGDRGRWTPVGGAFSQGEMGRAPSRLVA
jgi:hypothetical protein